MSTIWSSRTAIACWVVGVFILGSLFASCGGSKVGAVKPQAQVETQLKTKPGKPPAPRSPGEEVPPTGHEGVHAEHARTHPGG